MFYTCPICSQACSRQHNLLKHLMGKPPGHSKTREEADQLIVQAAPTGTTVATDVSTPTHQTTPGPKHNALKSGHESSLKMIEDTANYLQTRNLYQSKNVPVYLRPTDSGLTVLSLDYKQCRSMIGVGTRDTHEDRLSRIPPTAEAIQRACVGYEAKRDSLKRDSAEERYALQLMAGALDGNLSLNCGQQGLFYVHQEWRFATEGREKKIDILAAEPASGRFWTIELKATEADARFYDPRKGGDAWAQAADYANLLYSNRAELYPYFERLTRALAKAHNAPDILKTFKTIDSLPGSLVLWPPS